MLKHVLHLTAGIGEDASALSEGYDPERLHKLRVAMRRLRSMLKHATGHRAVRFRKTWGGHAAVTSRARDWDVFVATANELLEPASARNFERLNRAAVQASRDAVIRMVRSSGWQANLSQWQSWLERMDKARRNPFAGSLSLSTARDRARLALALALDTGDARAWHKFRIAVKELRYVADALLIADKPDPGLEHLVESCKPLQAALGSWHDAVIQLLLLDELPAATVNDELREALSESMRARLAEVRALCAGDPAVFGG